MEAHWHALTTDVAEFQASGPVLLLGDFNARTGRKLETDAQAMDELAALARHAGIALPAPPHPALALFQPRQSCDTVRNEMGQGLLQLCRSRGLAILNGIGRVKRHYGSVRVSLLLITHQTMVCVHCLSPIPIFIRI